MAKVIYACPLWVILALIAIGVLSWAFLSTRIKSMVWRIVNIFLSVLSHGAVLFLTIFDRGGGTYDVLLRPFSLLAAAKRQPELYRAMLMNVFLFFPLGLTLSNTLPQRWSRWGRIALTTALCCAFSAGIEYTQYRYALGVAETDDVICNTLGAFLGACSLLVERMIEIWREKYETN